MLRVVRPGQYTARAAYNHRMPEPSDHLAALLAKARALPRSAGVYLMKDDKGRVLYVGKAAVLPNRVASYFQPATVKNPAAQLGPKKAGMLDEVADFDTIACEGEWEALLTENRLIKDLHPKFNERLTDDKTFPYLVVTMRDDFPGVFITRTPTDESFRGGKVFGPFTSVYALRESIQLLQRVFKFRTCHLEIVEPAPGTQEAKRDPRRHFRPCLLHPIGQCTAPCAAKISKSAYREDIDRFVRFIGSKRSVMLREMRQEMDAASEAMQYERAAVLRDQIQAIAKLDDRGARKDGWQPETESFVADPRKGLESLRKALGMEGPIRCLECIDIAHLRGGETVGSKVCFVDGRPLKNEYRRYRIKTVEGGNDDYGSIREVVSRRYREAGQGHELYPDVVVIDGGLGQLNAALEALADMPHKPPMVISLAKREELIYQQGRPEPIKLGRENAGLKLCQAIRDEAHRFAQHYHHILRRKKVIGE